MNALPNLTTRLVCRYEARLGEPMVIGDVPGGLRRVVPILGGHVEGPALRGEIVPGGADWQIIAPDGSAAIEARYTIRADDGGLILVHSRGMRNGPAEVLARVAAGEAVEPSEYYFRTVVTLETGSATYEWVNRRLFIALAARLAAAVVVDLHEIE